MARNLVENAPDIAAAGGFSLADAADVSIAAQMVTDLAVGQLGSGLGGSVGNILEALRSPCLLVMEVLK